MSELFSIRDAPFDFKVALLRELGLDYLGGKVVDSEGHPKTDPYLGVEISLDRMVLMPGSTIVLDDNAASIAAYLAEHPDAD